MKRINYLLVVLAALSFTVACKNVNYKKAKGGLLYKIFPAKGNDSLIRNGQIAKFHYTVKLNDSLLFTSFGKLPGYQGVQTMESPAYNLLDILTLMKKGDSAVTVQLTDTLFKKGVRLPPAAKKGDRLITSFRILEVFSDENVVRADYEREDSIDKPRQMKEQEEQMAKAKKEQEAEELKETKEMEAYLAGKKINAQKTGRGTYVYIQQQGTGPAADTGTYLKIKYTGRILTTDSIFQSYTYPSLHLGHDPVVQGWTEGLQLFKQGGKGTLYIPGYLAYGSSPDPRSPFKPNQALIFEVEILEVSAKPIAQPEQQPPQPAK